MLKAKATDRLYDVPEYYLKASEYGTDIKHTVSGHFEIPSTQYHYHMETQQCLSVPSEEGMDIFSSSQWSDTSQIAVAEVLNVPVNTLNLQVRRLGGAFGGKISRQAHMACAASLGCHLSRRPVRLIMTMEDNMRAVGKRFSSVSDYVVDIDGQGKIQKLKHHYIHDQGCTVSEKNIKNSILFIFCEHFSQMKLFNSTLQFTSEIVTARRHGT